MNMPNVYLQGLELTNYRGIGETQTMAPFAPFNFFIGANNAGKSAVLSFIARHLPVPMKTYGAQAVTYDLQPLEMHGGLGRSTISMSLGIAKDDFVSTVLSRFDPSNRGPAVDGCVRKIVAAL